MKDVPVPILPSAPAPREQVISLAPFVVRRRVSWSECDAAGVVYTPRYGDFSADAGQVFLGHIFGGEGYTQGKQRQGIGTPCKALSLVFHSSLRPDDVVDISVCVGHIGTTTFELILAGNTPQDRLVFECNTTLIAVAPGTRKATPLPEQVRTLLAAWQCPLPRSNYKK